MSTLARSTELIVAAPPAPLTEPVLQRKRGCGQPVSGGECEECKKNKSDESSGGDPLLQRSAML
jgi:hypothetical protein